MENIITQNSQKLSSTNFGHFLFSFFPFSHFSYFHFFHFFSHFCISHFSPLFIFPHFLFFPTFYFSPLFIFPHFLFCGFKPLFPILLAATTVTPTEKSRLFQLVQSAKGRQIFLKLNLSEQGLSLEMRRKLHCRNLALFQKIWNLAISLRG